MRLIHQLAKSRWLFGLELNDEEVVDDGAGAGGVGERRAVGLGK